MCCMEKLLSFSSLSVLKVSIVEQQNPFPLEDTSNNII